MSLQKYIIAFALLAVISHAAQDCANPILTTYGFTKVGSAPVAPTGAKYCKSLTATGKTSCCSVATIDSFQTKSDALIKTLNDAVALRDQALVTARKTTIPGLSTKLAAFSVAAADAVAAIGKASTASTATADAALLKSIAAQTTLIATASGNLGALRSSLAGYQTTRKTCVEELVKIQAAAWCLACSADPSTSGVDATSGALTISTTLLESLTDACYNYISGSAAQSQIFSLSNLGSSLDDLTAALKKITAGTGSDDWYTAVGKITAAANSTPVFVPSGCTKDSCSWIETALFKNGQIDTTALTQGGTTTAPAASSRRVLASASGWNPDSDEAGTSVTFAQNPGSVDNSSAGLFKSVFGGLLVLLAVLLI